MIQTKLFSDLYLINFLNSSTKLSLPFFQQRFINHTRKEWFC